MIRLAKREDLNSILDIYAAARSFMEQGGNGQQWGKHHPPKDMLEEDIVKQQLYVYEQLGEIHGVFAFIIGNDPTYTHIEQGNWLNNAPYGTIHRIASSGLVKGVFNKCLDYCKGQIDNLRIDTHENNEVMHYLIGKSGFIKCGIIYVGDGTPRVAYHYVKSKS